MKKLFSLVLILGISVLGIAQNLKPYIHASTLKTAMEEAKMQVQSALSESGFTVLGSYRPASDANRWLFVVSHTELNKAVKSVGGLTGFAATLRVALTKEGEGIVVSYTNPKYWGNAYFRDDFIKVAGNYNTLSSAFSSALSKNGQVVNKPFGSEKGESVENLREYHYMFGMPYFDETVELGEFDSHSAALKHVDNALRVGANGVKKVYKYSVPGTDLTLYGVALYGETGEQSFMPTIDIGTPKHTAFLPYEFLVMNGEVHMLHGRYRIALSFPDLTMGTFTKIMSTPGDIEDLLKQLTD